MKTKLIKKSLSGFLKPQLQIELEADFIINKVEVFINNIKVNYNKNIKVDNEYLQIDISLDKKVKNIKIYIYSDKEKYLIFNKNYDYFIRILNIITKPFTIISNTIHNICHPVFKSIKIMWRRHHFIIPPKLLKRYIKSFIQNYRHPDTRTFYEIGNINDYNKWLEENKLELEPKFEYNPLISIIIPVYNIEEKYLRECIDSVLNQTYTNFEICIADDNSTKEETINTLKEYEKKDKRIKITYREENGMISNCMNSALKLATGEFVGFLDNDDLLDKNALAYVVNELNEYKDTDLIYTDEDKIDIKGKYVEPHFKPDYSPDTLLSMNYICHFTVVRKKMMDKVGNFNSEYDGAQDYDLFLRITEKTNKIRHINNILYHWRKLESSTAAATNSKNYARIAGKKALEAALKRRKISGEVKLPEKTSGYIVEYKLKKEPKVSIIIPTKDNKEILEKCIKSILEKTIYKNYDIIIIDNNTTNIKALNYLEHLDDKYKFIKILKYTNEFNYSKINNYAVNSVDSDYIVLLNNDTEVITKGWLKKMIGYATQEHIGCVGAKLLYPDATVQHAGVILGLGGVASHAYIGANRDDLGYFDRLVVPYNYSANTAACLAVSRKKYLQVGGLEEDLKVAYNDVDFNIKLLEQGYYNVCIPQVELFHYESKTRGLDTKGEKLERFKKETQYMNNKWGSLVKKDRFYNKNLSKNRWFALDRRAK